jgi:hypothetical protein
MLPRDLKAENFGGYPPMGRKLVTQNIEVLRVLPLSMLPNCCARPSITIINFQSNGGPRSELENLRSLSRATREVVGGIFRDPA